MNTAAYVLISSFLFFTPLMAAKPYEDPCKAVSNVANITQKPILEKSYKFAKQDELDLHGARMKNAQVLVTSFLEKAKSLKKKFVLVITGKGMHSAKTCTLTDGTQVGPIRYNVLSWLQTGVFAKTIKKFSYANGAHGGEGALYIELK